MTVGQDQKNVFYCLSTDTKPTIASAFGFCVESDTKAVYVTFNNGTTWTVIAGGAGEANTASNVGAGQGVWKAKTGVDLSFRSLTATSSKIALANNTNDIGIDVTEANLTLSNMTGPLSVAKGGTGQATATLGFDALSPMTTAGDVIIGGASGTRTRLGIGTANQLLRTNSGATAPEWASTLSGLTLTSPIVNTPTITAPVIQGAPKTKKTGAWYGRGNPPTAIPQADGVLTGLGIQFGNAHTTTIAAGALYSLETCSSSANNLTGMRFTTYTCRGSNPVFECKFLMTQTASCRMYLGFTSNGGVNPTTSADPLNTFAGLLFAYDSGVSANWYIHHNNAGASNTIDTTVAADTSAHTLNITAVDGTPSFIVSLDGSIITNGTVTGDIAAQTSALGIYTYMESLSTTSPSFRLYWLWTQTDG